MQALFDFFDRHFVRWVRCYDIQYFDYKYGWPTKTQMRVCTTHTSRSHLEANLINLEFVRECKHKRITEFLGGHIFPFFGMMPVKYRAKKRFGADILTEKYCDVWERCEQGNYQQVVVEGFVQEELRQRLKKEQ